jgi:hypothetical protein
MLRDGDVSHVDPLRPVACVRFQESESRSLEPIVRGLADIFDKDGDTNEDDLHRVTHNFDDAA